MKHTNKKACRCARCAAILAGATPAEADKQQKDWTQIQMLKYGWVAHLVAAGDPGSPTGFNLHTHGMQENYDHRDFQIVMPLPEKVGHALLITLVDRVKAGERFEDGQILKDVIANDLLVKLVAATECERPVLRLILPDKNGKLERDEIADPYRKQYADL